MKAGQLALRRAAADRLRRDRSRLVRGLVILCIFGALIGGSGCDRESRVIQRDGEPDAVDVGNDAEMAAAIAEARATADQFLRALATPAPNQTDFCVKRAYATTNGSGREHLWISNVRYDGALLHGTIDNEPIDVPNVKVDERVSFPPAELSDWMYLEDGKIVGGYTVRVVRKHLSPEERTEFDKRMPFKE